MPINYTRTLYINKVCITVVSVCVKDGKGKKEKQ